MPYLTEMAVDALKAFSSLVMADTRPPVGFFAYPGQPSLLADPSTSVLVLASPDEDALGRLGGSGRTRGRAGVGLRLAALERVALPTGGR